MSEAEIEEFFGALKVLEKVGADVTVEFDKEWDDYFRPRLEKLYVLDVDYTNGWVNYCISTNIKKPDNEE